MQDLTIKEIWTSIIAACVVISVGRRMIREKGAPADFFLAAAFIFSLMELIWGICSLVFKK